MSDSLDEKLRDVLKPWHITGCPFANEYGSCPNAGCKPTKLIAQVKQAVKDFLEAGGEL